MSLPNLKLMASVPDPKNPISGTKMTPRWSIFQDFSFGRCPEAPPGAPGCPRGELDCIYCSGLHAPPRDPVGRLGLPSPGPRPPGDYLTLLFLTLFFYLLSSNTCLLVDPHATTLVPRGRRISKGCALCRRPRRKKKTSRSNSNFAKVRIENPLF